MLSQQKNRLTELDGLRGLAALAVFISHAVGLLFETPIVNTIQSSPLRIIWDGEAAVDLFFVMSGFVLALPFIGKRVNPAYASYCIRRIFRLYPAFWFAIAFSLVMRAGYNPEGMLALSDWAKSQWTHPVTLGTVLQQIPLIFSTNTRAIDPVVWTLTVELRMSLLIPVIIFALNYSNHAFLDLLIAAASITLGSTIDALTFLPLFTIGALAAKHHSLFSERYSRIAATPAFTLAFIGIILIGNRWILHGLPSFCTHLVSSLGAIIIIYISTSSTTVAKKLSSPLMRFMGETSYSFYLLHFPTLLFITSNLYPTTNSMLICATLSLITSYLLSFLATHFIEKPGILFGKKIISLMGSPTARQTGG